MSLFLSTLSLRRATVILRKRNTPSQFLSTLSLRRATTDGLFFIDGRNDFYPRSPCGERQQAQSLKIPAHRISIHALLAESDVSTLTTTICIVSFLSTLSLRRATNGHGQALDTIWISIHALLAESDGVIDIINNVVNNFYPRSPCGERHLATWQPGYVCHFYPRSPCGERLNGLRHK